jgi:hypothetical protein
MTATSMLAWRETAGGGHVVGEVGVVVRAGLRVRRRRVGRFRPGACGRSPDVSAQVSAMSRNVRVVVQALDRATLTGMAVTIYGVFAVTFMMVMYAMERRGRGFVLAFAFGCVASSIYGFLSGAWPFGIVELIWAGIAVRRYQELVPT